MSIETAAVRLRWAIWILWGVLLLAYLAGRLGLSFVAVVHHLSDVVDGAAAKEAAVQWVR